MDSNVAPGPSSLTPNRRATGPSVRRKLAPTILAALAAALLAAPGASPIVGTSAGRPGVTTKRYIVVLKNGTNPGAVAARHARAFGAQVTHVYRSAFKGYAATIPSARVAALRGDSRVRFLSLDGKVQAYGQTLGTGVNRVNAESKLNKGAGVNVAVIDTGIDVGHPDLAANIAGGTNCSSGGNRNYDDGHGHGTHVAGIIAALDNGIGVVGVAPQAKLWAVRVLDKTGSGTWADVICGIDFVDSKSPAKGGPITVANMSLGGWGSDDNNCGNTNGDALHRAICRAVSDGVTFVVAAGNSSWNVSEFVPAAYDEVITVSALSDSDGGPCRAGSNTRWGVDDDFAWFSNFATSSADLNHLIAAPGSDIYSTYRHGSYATLSGTSMASPHVAGAAALYLATHPGAAPATVRDALKALGEPVNTNFNGECGGGMGNNNNNNRTRRASHTDSYARHPEVEVRADSL